MYNEETMEKTPLRIDKMFAFVAKDDDGNEGLSGLQVPSKQDPNIKEWMPLVGADMDRVLDLIPVAQAIANKTGKTIQLVVFENRQELTTFAPAIQPMQHSTSENQN